MSSRCSLSPCLRQCSPMSCLCVHTTSTSPFDTCCVLSCFEKISCFEMPHIGLDVVEDPEYDGTVSTMRPNFLFMVKNFVEQLFEHKLETKVVNGRQVRAVPTCTSLCVLPHDPL